MNWHQKSIPFQVSPEVGAEMSAFQRALDAEMNHWEQDMIDYYDDMLYGPRFGPDRRMLNEMLAPARRRARLRAEVADKMPGKRAGRFVRL